MTDDEGLIRLPRVMELVGLRRSTLYKLIRAGGFPRPVALHPTTCRAWRVREIRRWIEERPTAGRKQSREVKEGKEVIE